MTGFDPAGYYDHGCRACGHTEEIHDAAGECVADLVLCGKTTRCNCPGWQDQPEPEKPLNPMRITADHSADQWSMPLDKALMIHTDLDYIKVIDPGIDWLPTPEPVEPPYVEVLAQVWVDTGGGAGRILGDASAAAAINAICKRLDDVDALANEMRRVDGKHDMATAELAEHIVQWMLERLV